MNDHEEGVRFPALADVLVGLSLCGFMFACVLPVVGNNLRGYQALMFVPFPPWWANPLCLVGYALSFTPRRRLAWMASLSSLLLSLSTMLFDFSDGPGLEIGYFLWAFSIATLGGAGVVVARFQSQLAAAEVLRSLRGRDGHPPSS